MWTTECSLIVDFQTHTYITRNSCSIWARINVKFKRKITTFVSHIFACLLERTSSAHRRSNWNRASRDLSFARYDRKLVPFYAIFQGSVRLPLNKYQPILAQKEEKPWLPVVCCFTTVNQ